MTSRETAAAVGERALQRHHARRRLGAHSADPHDQREPAARARGTLDDVIADTDDGIYMETNRSWSIDDRRYNFQFGCEIGWEIKRRQARPDAEEPELQRHHHRVLEFLRRHLRTGALDALGHAQLRQGPARADDGHRPRRRPSRFRNVKIGIAYAG